jgi:predicted GNAT family N-acyltransferase
MIQGKLILGQDNLSEIRRIWHEVFVEEGKIPKELIDASIDNTVHAIVYEGVDVSCPVAAGRMTMEETSAEIELVAVLKEFRDKEYGDFVVRMLLDKAVTAGKQNILVKAPESMKGFFQKQGFIASGEDIDQYGRKCIIMNYNHKIIKKCCKEP